jgi:formamidopyrimidine-DNA glycosylase
VAERPDLEYAIPILAKELAGRRITAVRVKKPIVLRVAVPGTLDELLVGQAFAGVERRAHFVHFQLAAPKKGKVAVELVVLPMLAGRFLLAPAKDKSPADLAVAFELDDGRELRYRDDVQMGKVYVVPAGDFSEIAGWDRIGVDVLDAKKFTVEAFRALARKRRDQAKVFLMDKSAIDAFGNAYADEALWAAKIHPKAAVRTLSDHELDRLHDAMVETLREANEQVQKRQPPLDEKYRDFLRVRNRHGAECPRCGDKIRKAGVHGHDAFFCPTCQVLPGGGGGLGTKSIVDWRKTKG